MAMSTPALFAGTLPINGGDRITNDYGTEDTVMWSTPVFPATLDALLLSSDDTIDTTLNVKLSLNGFWIHLGEVVVPAGAGHAGVAPVDAIGVLLPADSFGISLPPGGALALTALVAVTAGKGIDVVCLGHSV